MDIASRDNLRRDSWILVTWGVIALLFGAGMLLWPGITGVGLVIAFGVMSLAEGLIAVTAVLRTDPPLSKTWKTWLLLYAAASILFALCALFQPLLAATVLLVFLAAWLVVAGVVRIAFAIQARREIEGEWLLALSGALAVLLGVLFVLFPLAGLVAVAMWISVAAFVYGVLQVIAGIRLRRLARLPVVS